MKLSPEKDLRGAWMNGSYGSLAEVYGRIASCVSEEYSESVAAVAGYLPKWFPELCGEAELSTREEFALLRYEVHEEDS